MNSKRTHLMALGLIASGAGLAFLVANLQASPGGVSGKSQSPQGCNCHSTSPNASGVATVSLTGPQTVQPGSTSTYTLSVSGGPTGTTGGFDLAKSAGTFIAGTGSKVLNNDLVQSSSGARSWTFQWTAPATEGACNLYAVGQATNGSGTSGDSWNWYGGAQGTAFVITVSPPVGVGDGGASRVWLAPAAPNPTSGPARLEYSLAEAGPAQLEIFNVTGRRVALLASGSSSSGRHVQTWSGRDDGGRLVPSGQYFVRLVAGGTSLSRTLFLVR
jgi:hypothetical protein